MARERHVHSVLAESAAEHAPLQRPAVVREEQRRAPVAEKSIALRAAPEGVPAVENALAGKLLHRAVGVRQPRPICVVALDAVRVGRELPDPSDGTAAGAHPLEPEASGDAGPPALGDVAAPLGGGERVALLDPLERPVHRPAIVPFGRGALAAIIPTGTIAERLALDHREVAHVHSLEEIPLLWRAALGAEPGRQMASGAGVVEDPLVLAERLLEGPLLGHVKPGALLLRGESVVVGQIADDGSRILGRERHVAGANHPDHGDLPALGRLALPRNARHPSAFVRGVTGPARLAQERAGHRDAVLGRSLERENEEAAENCENAGAHCSTPIICAFRRTPPGPQFHRRLLRSTRSPRALALGGCGGNPGSRLSGVHQSPCETQGGVRGVRPKAGQEREGGIPGVYRPNQFSRWGCDAERSGPAAGHSRPGCRVSFTTVSWGPPRGAAAGVARLIHTPHDHPDFFLRRSRVATHFSGRRRRRCRERSRPQRRRRAAPP